MTATRYTVTIVSIHTTREFTYKDIIEYNFMSNGIYIAGTDIEVFISTGGDNIVEIREDLE